MAERRRFSRVSFEIEAVVMYKHKTFKCKVQNISLNGMFIKTPEKIPTGEILQMIISLTGDSSCLSINLEGMVLRNTGEGLALQYKKVDLDSFIHLKSIVAYNVKDAEKVMEEFHSFIQDNNSRSV